MTVCGYHPRMSAGIEEFAEGLIQAVAEKAGREGRSLPSQMAVECDEIFILKSFLLKELEKLPQLSPEARRIEAFLAIVLMAQVMMPYDASTPVTADSFGELVRSHAHALGESVKAYEEAFEDAPKDLPSLEKLRQAYQAVFGAPGDRRGLRLAS